MFMEDFKIKLFKEEYKKDFPLYIHLSKKECLIIVEKLLDMYNLPDIDTMIAYLCTNEKFFSNIEVENEFKLTEVLGCLSIEALENVYINWYKFDDIDIVKLQDLNKYFFDIWYPGSDDIDIFDESLSWVISVRHDGSVSYLKV
jgi:hypothetical protein